MLTSEHYSPHDLLPAPEPATYDPSEDYFYQHVAKHLIKDTVRLQNNGLPINLDRVAELEKEVDKIIAEVESTLASNEYISKYLEHSYKSQIAAYQAEQKSKMKSAKDFPKPFDYKDMQHRSYFMHIFAQKQGIEEPTDLLPTGVPKWSANTVKKLTKSRPLLSKLLAGQLPDNHPIIKEALALWSQHKADMYNKSYVTKIEDPKVDYPKFNPNSSKMKTELFDMLGIKSEKTSKTTGEPSWDRSQVERVNKETSDPIILELTQAMIDHSFAAIVRSNFINSFYKYTIDGKLYGQYKLLGAKSGRYTSSNPNMLNAPSTGSIFAKPIKRCFQAPEGFIVATADFSALEDRVIASLSRDTNKCNVFLEGLDGHCLNAYGYFKEEVAAEMDLTNDTVTDVKNFFELTETNKTLKNIRQKGKPATFGLSYGAFPPKVADTLKIPLHEAEQIFNRYHNELYAGITDYRENYVLPTAMQNGRIHLGLGFYIKTDDPGRDIRTVNNASCQFWSILTALTINKMHQLIDEAGLENDIQVTSTIYDSIYFNVRKDPKIVKWLNDTLIPIMTQDFMQNQIIKNTADLEIGPDWADLHLIHNNATLEDIEQALKDI